MWNIILVVGLILAIISIALAFYLRYLDTRDLSKMIREHEESKFKKKVE